MRPAHHLRIGHCLSVLGLGLALVGSLVGCDTVGDAGDSEMTVVVEVEGLDPYAGGPSHSFVPSPSMGVK